MKPTALCISHRQSCAVPPVLNTGHTFNVRSGEVEQSHSSEDKTSEALLGTAQEGHPGSQGHQAAQQGVNTPSRQRLGTVRQVALREMPQRLEVQELRQLHTMLPLTAQRICTCLTPLLGVLRLYERGSKTTQDCAHHLTLLSRPCVGVQPPRSRSRTGPL